MYNIVALNIFVKLQAQHLSSKNAMSLRSQNQRSLIRILATLFWTQHGCAILPSSPNFARATSLTPWIWRPQFFKVLRMKSICAKQRRLRACLVVDEVSNVHMQEGQGFAVLRLQHGEGVQAMGPIYWKTQKPSKYYNIVIVKIHFSNVLFSTQNFHINNHKQNACLYQPSSCCQLLDWRFSTLTRHERGPV